MLLYASRTRSTWITCLKNWNRHIFRDYEFQFIGHAPSFRASSPTCASPSALGQRPDQRNDHWRGHDGTIRRQGSSVHEGIGAGEILRGVSDI